MRENKHPLIIIPARGGSKGIPGKNIVEINGKPLLHYSIEFARKFVPDNFICLSTDSTEIADCAREIGLDVPFIRPQELASDTAGTSEVLLHAINFYNSSNLVDEFDKVVLLQPTSPIRLAKHFIEAMQCYNAEEEIDMVVSVAKSKVNPYFNLFEEGTDGCLHPSKSLGEVTRRQDAPEVFAYNGSIYIVRVNSLIKAKELSKLPRIIKYVMEDVYSFDIDTPIDLKLCEFIMQSLKPGYEF